LNVGQTIAKKRVERKIHHKVYGIAKPHMKSVWYFLKT